MALRTAADDFSAGHRRAPWERATFHRAIVAFLTDNATVFDETEHVQRDTGGVHELRRLRPGMRGITVIARVSNVETQRIESPHGTTTVSLGTLSDDSGQLPFVARESEALYDGVVLRIMHGTVTEVNDERVLIVTDRSVLIPVHHEEMPPINTLAELKSGDKGVNLVVAVLTTELKRVGSRFVLIGILADESGKLPFTSWGPHLDEGAVLRVENAYVKGWNGMPTINISDATELYEVDCDVPARLVAPHHVQISDLGSREGAYDVIVRGDVTSIRPGSGVIERCPHCRRIGHDGRCVAHGAITPVPDFRIKASIDDGTGTMTAILGRQASEALCRALGTGEAAKSMKSLCSFEVNVQRLLIGRALTLRGNATTGKYGTTFVVSEAVIENEHERMSQLKRRMEDW